MIKEPSRPGCMMCPLQMYADVSLPTDASSKVPQQQRWKQIDDGLVDLDRSIDIPVHVSIKVVEGMDCLGLFL